MQIMESQRADIPEVSDITHPDKVVMAFFFSALAPLTFFLYKFFGVISSILRDLGP